MRSSNRSATQFPNIHTRKSKEVIDFIKSQNTEERQNDKLTDANGNINESMQGLLVYGQQIDDQGGSFDNRN